MGRSSGADSLWKGGTGRAVVEFVVPFVLGSGGGAWAGVRDGRAREELRGGPWIRTGAASPDWTGMGGMGLSLSEYTDEEVEV